MSQDLDLDAFLELYLGKAPRPQPLRVTVTRRPERTQDSLTRLLAAGRLYLKLAQEDLRQ